MSTLQKMLDHRREQTKKDHKEAIAETTPLHPEKAQPKPTVLAELGLTDIKDEPKKAVKKKK